MSFKHYERVVKEKVGYSWYDGEAHPEFVAKVLKRPITEIRGRSYELPKETYKAWVEATDMDMIHGVFMWRWGRIDTIDKWGRKVFRKENMKFGEEPVEPDWKAFEKRLEELSEIKGDRGLEWTLYNPTMLVSNGFGMENFCFAIKDQREDFKFWLEQIDEVVQKELELILKYPVDVVKITQIFATKQGLLYDSEWEEVELDYVKRRCERIKKAGRMVSIHCDGVTDWLVDRFISAGVDVWRGWEGTNWEKDFQKWGKKITFHGTVLVDDLMRQEPDMIKRLVQSRAKCGSQILASAHDFGQTGISFNNFKAVMEEARRFRDGN